MTKQTIIAEIKAEFPTLTKSFDGADIELSAEEYEETIAAWADAKLAEAQKAAAEAEKAAAKAALLEKLGLTQEEASLLLA